MTNFPASLPGLPANYTNETAVASSIENNQENEINAIAAKVGIDASANQSSHDYKLSGLTGSEKAASEGDVTSAAATAAANLASHASDPAVHGVAQVAGIADINTHAADTSTHGVAQIAGIADIEAHGLDTSTHGVGEVVGTTETQTLTNKTLTSPVLQGDMSGWNLSTDTWNYVSGTSFAIADVDRTSIFQKGTKVRLKQGGSYKYFYVISSSFSTNTTVNVIGGDDYSIASAAITDNYYSYSENPQGFPNSFSFTPAISGTGGSAGAYAQDNAFGRFSLKGKMCHMSIYFRITNKGSWTGDVQLTLPISGNNTVNADKVYLPIYITPQLSNPVTATRGMLNIISATIATFKSAVGSAYLDFAAVVNNDSIMGQGFYEI